jgi:hypothetical protein
MLDADLRCPLPRAVYRAAATAANLTFPRTVLPAAIPGAVLPAAIPGAVLPAAAAKRAAAFFLLYGGGEARTVLQPGDPSWWVLLSQYALRTDRGPSLLLNVRTGNG